MTTTFSPKATLNFEVDSLSDRGKKQYLNEDAIFDFTTHTQAGMYAGLYVVCDGEGGQRVGDIASQMAVETLATQLVPFISKCQAIGGGLHDEHISEVQRSIKDAVDKANERICLYNQEKLQNGKAEATMTMAFLQGREAIVANVGDGRAYIWHENQLTRINEEHLLAVEWEDSEVAGLDKTQLSSETWSMGLNNNVKVDLYGWELEVGDKLLLCSDGLWQAFDNEEELASFLYANRHAHDICRNLIFEANRRDGSDNISAVIISAA